MKKQTKKESLSNFGKNTTGYGHAKVFYTSPKTGKMWGKTMETNSDLFHNVFEKESTSQRDFNDLKRFLKLNNRSI